MNKTFIYRNILVNLVQTNKFKSVIIDTSFAGEFSKETISKKSLLYLMLENNNKYTKTKEQCINKAFELYNAVVDVNISVNHQVLTTTFSLDIIDYNLIDKPDLLNDALEYYRQFIFDADCEGGLFSQEVFNEKKRAIKDSIIKTYNNKASYALRKLLENMCKDELLSIPVNGKLEDLEKITNKDIYNAYCDMIENEAITITITGNVDENAAKAIVDRIIGKKTYSFKKNEYNPYDSSIHKIDKVRHFYEEQQINQSKLVMGFRFDINYQSKYARALQLFNIMFGGLYLSNLFQKIREEKSLAYSIYSDCYISNQLLFVCCGINASDYETVEKLVLEELEKYQSGNVDEGLLNQAKSFALSDIEKLEDSNYSLTNFYYRQSLLKSDKTIEDIINEYKNVTASDIIYASQQVKLDSVFLLRGVKNE